MDPQYFAKKRNPPTVVNKRRDKYDVYIGRGSKWGNIFEMANRSMQERMRVIEAYRTWIQEPAQQHLLDSLDELTNKRIGCFCSPLPCHGDVLVELWKERFENATESNG